jgi:hypothetical protein
MLCVCTQIHEIFLFSKLNIFIVYLLRYFLVFLIAIFYIGLKDLELQLRSVKSDSTFDLVCKVGSLFDQIKFDTPSLPKRCAF